jgi:hypothetical protein
MKRICILLVMIGLAALGAKAQTVTGSGTTNTVPKFTGSTSIGDSLIVEFNGNIGIGTKNPGWALEVDTSNTISPQGQCCPGAIKAVQFASVDAATAIVGEANANSGRTFGVLGNNFSPDGNGVLGNHPIDGGGGGGVRGQTNSTQGFSYGTAGVALGADGPAVGIFGQSYHASGAAGLFHNVVNGNLLTGIVGDPAATQTVFRVDGKGTIFADGGFRPFGADFAESVAVKGGSEHYAPGDLLVIDASGERRLSLSQVPYSTLIVGIYSTQPGVVASTHRVDEALPNDEVPLAVVGIVPCKVTTENGAIAPGDLLVTSSTPGHAMKGTDRGRLVGAVVGKALEPFQKGAGVIQVLVTLQ